jgi:formylglycine-generating enzyme required for sulfatase activity
MRLVPSGTFLMGSNDQFVQNAVRMCRESGGNDPCVYSEFSNELPEHAVDVDAFYMDVTEVTNARYRACVDAGDCAAPSNRRYFNAPQYDNFPVVYVSWYDARQYCLSVGERLPTEAEWEKAALSNDSRPFPWGHVWDPARTNSEEQGGNRLRPAGQFPSGASPFGILDLSGNVWEWVSDWYDPLYYQDSPIDNPQGPPEGSDKVLRGGGFSNFVHYVRTTNRGFEPPGSSSTYRGFRCAVSASQVGN